MAHQAIKSPLRGIVPPIVTPLTPSGEVDRAALGRLIEHVVTGGVQGLFVLGTTGEGPALSYRVRQDLVEAACEFAAGRVPVLVGVTDTSLAEAIEMSVAATEAGANAVVLAPPSYFPIDQADLVRAVRLLASESPLPVMLYNMPALTKTVIEPDTVRELLDEPMLIGMKDSSGDLAYFKTISTLIRQRPDWSLLAGPEHLLAETIALGGYGGVCGGANLFPELFVRLYQACRVGDQLEADRLTAAVTRLGALYRLGTNPAMAVIQGVKAGLAELGLCDATLCAPFAPLDSGRRDAVRLILREVAACTATPQEAVAPV